MRALPAHYSIRPKTKDDVKTFVAPQHDFDDFLVEMFGESQATPGTSNGSTPFLEQIKAIDVGQHQAHNFDVRFSIFDLSRTLETINCRENTFIPEDNEFYWF